MEEKKQEAIIEAILFTVGESVELEKLAAVLELDKEKTKTLVEHLRERYESDTCGMKIIELDGAYQMCTKAEYYEYLIKIAKTPRKMTLTDTVLETLSIIAYKQPMTRAQVEEIRGVNSDHAVTKLLEKRLICEVGRADTPGKPILFGTSKEFLRYFGFKSIRELPPLEEENPEEAKKKDAETEFHT